MMVGVAAIFAVAGIGGYMLFASKPVETTPASTATSQVATTNPAATAAAPSTTTTQTTTQSTQTTNTSGYKDGTYSATERYSVPHQGVNTMNLSVTVSAGKITAIVPNDTYTDGESARWIDSFEQSVSRAMVGQKLGTTSASVIGGASLTSGAFFSALDTITAQAKI